MQHLNLPQNHPVPSVLPAGVAREVFRELTWLSPWSALYCPAPLWNFVACEVIGVWQLLTVLAVRLFSFPGGICRAGKTAVLEDQRDHTVVSLPAAAGL